MTREEQYASMFQQETVYRPLQEEDSVLLEVSLGCSWHKCAFCDFTRDPFRLLPLETIRQSAQTLQELGIDGERVFLLGQNPFVRDTDSLLEIFQMVHQYIPSAREISMYARIDDVLRKSDGELLALKEAGLCDLHIGVESGSDSVLLLANKGVTCDDMRRAFARLDGAGIGYHVTLVLGLGGKHLWKASAIETARLLNRTHPKTIWCLGLHLFPGTVLHKQAKQGLFEPMTYREMMFEERTLLECLTVEDCYFMDTTAMGMYTLGGMLPQAKESLLNAMNRFLREEHLSTVVQPDNGLYS